MLHSWPYSREIDEKSCCEKNITFICPWSIDSLWELPKARHATVPVMNWKTGTNPRLFGTTCHPGGPVGKRTGHPVGLVAPLPYLPVCLGDRSDWLINATGSSPTGWKVWPKPVWLVDQPDRNQSDRSTSLTQNNPTGHQSDWTATRSGAVSDLIVYQGWKWLYFTLSRT